MDTGEVDWRVSWGGRRCQADVAWRAAGYSVTRRNCESYGMSRRRWVWAVGLLKLARVLGDQVASADTFLIEDVGECAEAIERAVRAEAELQRRSAAAEGGGEDARE